MSVAAVKTVVFAVALIPCARLLVGAFTGELTANPIEFITHQTGWYALLFLTLTLGVTPARRLTNLNAIVRFRRPLGLFSFFYATLHMLTWLVFDQFFSIAAMIDDVVTRPFITAGMATYLLLLPLALTSTTGMIRRLGGARWRRLHQLVYVAGVTAVVHFWWVVKSDTREPLRWAIAIAALLGVRAWWRAARGRRAAR